ncbi:(S)-benzoin forming benzil reductase [Bacillus xiamenensis]|uniref:(S)-benzoin forming benzil reductase n=1 Tax=Bacillus TaxID=1386 RepID=UPI00028EBEA5|nr:(S)-benzoin forming benzil reductase [Bacillus xiamenensis]EKF36072.1 short chain dehydrogenase [Bacillus xiamenensis]QGX64868.1 (S)-benzoin forming benzil reductase [Bacillus sp. ms-22]
MTIRISIVTGGSKGFGLALVKRLLSRGDHVFTSARSAAPISHPHLTHTQVDLTDEEAAAKWLQDILSSQTLEKADDILFVNNAGMVTPIKRVGQGGQDTLHRHYTLNLMMPVLLSHMFVRETQSFKGKKTIVHLSSGAAKNPYKGWSAYCSSKAGLDMFMRTLHEEQQDEAHPITTFSFSPGTIDTDMQGEIRKASKQDFEQIERFQQLYETGTLKSPDEVAGILLDLLADEPAGGCVYDAREYGKKQS